MKKGEIYEGIVENMDFPNKGNIYIEGERVIVQFSHMKQRKVEKNAL